jgi:hypothetical protein
MQRTLVQLSVKQLGGVENHLKLYLSRPARQELNILQQKLHDFSLTFWLNDWLDFKQIADYLGHVWFL